MADNGTAELVDRVARAESIVPQIGKLWQSSDDKFDQWTAFSIATIVIGCVGVLFFVGLVISMLLSKKRHPFREDQLYAEV